MGIREDGIRSAKLWIKSLHVFHRIRSSVYNDDTRVNSVIMLSSSSSEDVVRKHREMLYRSIAGFERSKKWIKSPERVYGIVKFLSCDNNWEVSIVSRYDDSNGWRYARTSYGFMIRYIGS